MQLQRGLSQRHVNLISLGGIIGSSYFLGTGLLLNQMGPGAFLAYLLGGIITYLTMACLAELTIGLGQKGSFILFANKLISPSFATAVGWSYWISWIVFVPSECVAAGIIMNAFSPILSVFQYAAIFGMIITLINLLHVKFFGEVEFWLAMIKIFLLASFSVLAIAIYFGFAGTGTLPVYDKEFFDFSTLFPSGIVIVLINMVILISNFQGSEIIGLSAAESKNPEVAIPSSLKKIAIRIALLYLVPTFLLGLIFPWQKAGLAHSVFSEALESFGFLKFGHLFSVLIIAGAISSANSGLYATIRSLYALGTQGFAPKKITILNKNGTPIYATFFTLAMMWVMLLAAYLFKAHNVYANLLAISGFTGSICWISICWSQLRYRRTKHKTPHYQIPGYPYLTHASIWLQLICLAVVVLSPALRPSFYFGAPCVILPMLLYKWYHKTRNKNA
jgi:AAT family amino acid transporter